MAKEWAKQFYNSTAWQQCRDSFFASQFGLCERCGEAGLIVHHKIALTPDNINNPDITLNWEHLELLCQDCHNREHGKSDKNATAEGLMFDEHGDLVPIPPL